VGQQSSALADTLFNLVQGYGYFLIGLSVIGVASFLIVHQVKLANQRLGYRKLIEEHTQRLAELAHDKFMAQPCPRCYESKLSIERISANGRSIKCRCLECGESQYALATTEEGFQAASILTTLMELRLKHNLLSSRHPIESVDVHFSAPEAPLPFQQAGASIPVSILSEVWRRDSGCCAKCGSNQQLEIDHVIPISKGGATSVRNLQLLCRECNRSKNTSWDTLGPPASALFG